MLDMILQRTAFLTFSLISFLMVVSTRRTSKISIDNSKIIGGEVTTINQVPYLVNLRQNGYFSCGGSLVTPNCVLTAAHCTHGVAPSTITVHAGVSKLSETGNVAEVQQNFVSPFYSPTNLNMDVAILKLATPLRGENIATISLCNTRPDDRQLVKISGWGITDENNRDPSDQVRTVNVPIISNIACTLAYAGRAQLTSTMFCAAVLGEKDSCSGDSGGPVVYNGQVCGIVSWGFGCASSKYPGVYTNIASARVKAFVRQIIVSNCQ